MADIQAQISKLKEAGFSDAEVATHFNAKLSDAGFSKEEIGGFLKGLDVGPSVVNVGGGGRLNTFTLDDINRFMAENAPKKKMLDMLPALGATALTAAVPAAGPGLLPVIANVLRAGAGGMLGRVIQNAAQAEGPVPAGSFGERLTDPLIEGAKMAGFEAATAGAGPLLRPGAERLAGDPAAQKLLKFSQEQNLPFSPSTVVPSKTASLIEGLVNFTPTGKLTTMNQQAKLSKWLLDARSQVIKDLTGVEMGGTGQRLIAETSQVKEGMKKGAKEAYGQIVPSAGGEDVMIPMETTGAFLRSLYDDGIVGNRNSLKSLIAEFERRLKPAGEGLKPSQMSARDFSDWQALIGPKAAQSGVYKLGEKIWGNVERDITGFDASQNAKLLDAVKNAKTDYAAMKRYEKLTGYFNMASGVGSAGQEVFQTGKFYSIIVNEKNKAALVKDIGEEAYGNLRDFAEMALKVSEETGKKDVNWLSQGLSATIAGGAAKFGLAGPALAVPYALAPVVGWKIMQPKSVFKKWLTEGLNPQTTKAVLKVGGRVAISGDSE